MAVAIEASDVQGVEEQQAVVTLTETAAEKLLAIMDEKGVRATHGLRVFVSGGGWYAKRSRPWMAS